MGAISVSSTHSSGPGIWTRIAMVLSVAIGSFACGSLSLPFAIIFGQPLWVSRLRNHDWKLDFSLYLIIGLWFNGLNDFKAFSLSIKQWPIQSRTTEIQIFAILVLLAIFAGLIVYRGEESGANGQDDRGSNSESISSRLLLPGLGLPLATSLWMNGVDDSGSLIGWSAARSMLELRSMEVQVFAVLILLAIMAGAIATRGEDSKEPTVFKTPLAKEFLLPPLLIPGRTTHTRFFPEKHSFNYSYLSVGIPVGWKGRAGSALSADVNALLPTLRRWGWFNINAADYLYRGGAEVGLEERLSTYLRGEGVADEEWSFAYLLTQPRFLGYSFNPVSFWYIYSGSSLKMMILEVNNTFDERRIYLLKATETVSQQPPLPNGDAIDEDEEAAPSKAVKFTNSWEKDFHVSPFNSRKGKYALTAVDPVANLHQPDKKLIDNTIVLKSSKDHVKLVARLFSEGSAKDPSTISNLELAIFLARWFWVGFMTFPRIIREAFKLYFRRGLNVWFRPEILPSSIGRNHTKTEQYVPLPSPTIPTDRLSS